MVTQREAADAIIAFAESPEGGSVRRRQIRRLARRASRDHLVASDWREMVEAVVEVYNARNARLGKFCRRCGRKRLRELQREEKRNG